MQEGIVGSLKKRQGVILKEWKTTSNFDFTRSSSSRSCGRTDVLSKDSEPYCWC